jgi:hypothetical protein
MTYTVTMTNGDWGEAYSLLAAMGAALQMHRDSGGSSHVRKVEGSRSTWVDSAALWACRQHIREHSSPAVSGEQGVNATPLTPVPRGVSGHESA